MGTALRGRHIESGHGGAPLPILRPYSTTNEHEWTRTPLPLHATPFWPHDAERRRAASPSGARTLVRPNGARALVRPTGARTLVRPSQGGHSDHLPWERFSIAISRACRGSDFQSRSAAPAAWTEPLRLNRRRHRGCNPLPRITPGHRGCNPLPRITPGYRGCNPLPRIAPGYRGCNPLPRITPGHRGCNPLPRIAPGHRGCNPLPPITPGIAAGSVRGRPCRTKVRAPGLHAVLEFCGLGGAARAHAF